MTVAIDRVFASYRLDDKFLSPDDQVLIQVMVPDVALSGVVFTRDQRTGTPFYVIEYDESVQTDTVTGGTVIPKSLLVWRHADIEQVRSPRMRAILHAVGEIEKIYDHAPLDIEFIYDNSNTVWILQIRPLTALPVRSGHQEQILRHHLHQASDTVNAAMACPVGLYGSRTLFSDMADWNPAEMIGIAPSPLAASLYRQLITDVTWRQARAMMGYRKLPEVPLMVDILGHPYIDLRCSFNSFLPENFQADIGEKIINAWIDRVSQYPELHDKVEFDVATTCYTPDHHAFMTKTYPGLLNKSESQQYADLLLDLTNTCLDPSAAFSPDWCCAQTGILEEIQKNSSIDKLYAEGDLSATLTRMIEECRRFGTLPFAIAARHAFIAESILRGLINNGTLTGDEVDAFKRCIPTIAHSILSGLDDKAAFYRHFGHIRPSSYDIESPRYDMLNDLLNTITAPAINIQDHSSIITSCMTDRVNSAFVAIGYTCTASAFFDYVRKSIQLRESIKAVFTRHISDILELIARHAADNSVARIFAAHVEIDSYLSNNFDWHLPRPVQDSPPPMSYLIESAKDLYIIPIQRSKPNYITKLKVFAPLMNIHADCNETVALSGKIVYLERADPGFDWIFGCGIVGLVTKYGGANSHMAIRCAEFGIPAAIGCGELLYRRISASSHAQLDCAAEIITLLDEIGSTSLPVSIQAS